MEVFSSVSQMDMIFLTFPFPVPLARGSRYVPKNFAILLAVTSNHVQVRLGDNVQQHCTRQSTKLLLYVCHACRVNIALTVMKK